METSHHEILIIGAGAAGITTAAHLLNHDPAPAVTLLDPASKHYYQPLWTLVGGGVTKKEETEREMADFIPDGATWIQDAATEIDPAHNTVRTRDGRTLTYDYLVVAPGLKVHWDGIPGLKESIGKGGVCSNYDYHQSDYTWEALQALGRMKGQAKALFTQPSGPFKCGGAPQKIMYLAADYLRKHGRLRHTQIQFFTPGTVIFGVVPFAKTLNKVIKRYGITPHFYSELIEIRPDKQEAVFRMSGGDGAPTTRVESYNFLHVVPPQSAPDFLKASPLANTDGWTDVDKGTLQHVRFPNVFGLGDAGSTPNAKTGAAIRKQAPIVAHNLLQYRKTGALAHPEIYTGYSSCPLITGYGKLILAEFDYNNQPMPSFPFDTSQERYSMYVLKKDVLPGMYWHGMLKGRA